jgi:hypothetical protein
MWMALVFIGTFPVSAAYSDQLSISNVRPTYGFLGPRRQDNKVLPGDTYVIAFEIEGLKNDDAGKVKYRMAMEATDSKGKVVFSPPPRDLESNKTLGGFILPEYAFISTGPTQAPGEYSVTISVTDQTNNVTRQAVHSFEVVPKTFGIIQASIFADANFAFPAPALGVPGQSLWLRFATIGFERDAAKHQPSLQVRLRIVDENGKSTLAAPPSGELNDDVGADVVAIPWQFKLELNRAGRFTIEADAIDRISKKSAKVSLPLVVAAQRAAGEGSR